MVLQLQRALHFHSQYVSLKQDCVGEHLQLSGPCISISILPGSLVGYKCGLNSNLNYIMKFVHVEQEQNRTVHFYFPFWMAAETPLFTLIGVLSKHKEKGAAGDALKLGGVERGTKRENNFRWRNGIGGDWNRSREERWMKVDNRHYCPPAGVFVWMQSAVWVTHRHKDIYKTQIHTFVE